MPMYRVKCDICNHESDIFRSVARYNELPVHCHLSMRRMVCAPMVNPDIGAYKSMVTGEMIDGRVKHRDHLKRHNCVEVGNEKLGPKKYEGDHNVRPEMMEAIKQHLGR